MQWVFEPLKDQSVQQIAIWAKYKATFLADSVDEGHWCAPELIQHTGSVFPSTHPMKTPDRKFVINNMHFRNRDGVPPSYQSDI